MKPNSIEWHAARAEFWRRESVKRREELDAAWNAFQAHVEAMDRLADGVRPDSRCAYAGREAAADILSIERRMADDPDNAHHLAHELERKRAIVAWCAYKEEQRP